MSAPVSATIVAALEVITIVPSSVESIAARMMRLLIHCEIGETRMMRSVPVPQERLALVRGERAAQGHRCGGGRVDRTHAALRHRLVRIVFETLDIDDQAVHRRTHHGGRARRPCEDRVGQVVRHAQQLVLQLVVGKQELIAHPIGNEGGIVRHVKHHPRRQLGIVGTRVSRGHGPLSTRHIGLHRLRLTPHGIRKHALRQARQVSPGRGVALTVSSRYSPPRIQSWADAHANLPSRARWYRNSGCGPQRATKRDASALP